MGWLLVEAAGSVAQVLAEDCLFESEEDCFWVLVLDDCFCAP
jgi:hypothetical protein